MAPTRWTTEWHELLPPQMWTLCTALTPVHHYCEQPQLYFRSASKKKQNKKRTRTCWTVSNPCPKYLNFVLDTLFVFSTSDCSQQDCLCHIIASFADTVSKHRFCPSWPRHDPLLALKSIVRPFGNSASSGWHPHVTSSPFLHTHTLRCSAMCALCSLTLVTRQDHRQQNSFRRWNQTPCSLKLKANKLRAHKTQVSW